MNLAQSAAYTQTLSVFSSESLNDIIERSDVNARGQITFLTEVRPLFHSGEIVSQSETFDKDSMEQTAAHPF